MSAAVFAARVPRSIFLDEGIRGLGPVLKV